ncbi:hypothetical protein IAR50_000857 [Cryptococcus sp. DSM 104548]
MSNPFQGRHSHHRGHYYPDEDSQSSFDSQEDPPYWSSSNPFAPQEEGASHDDHTWPEGYATGSFNTDSCGHQYRYGDEDWVYGIPQQPSPREAGLSGTTRRVYSTHDDSPPSPTSHSLISRRHEFGMQAKPPSAVYDEKQTFWSAPMPGSETDTMTTAYGDWLNGQATNARTAMDNEERKMRRKREKEVPRQTALTNTVYKKATKYIPRLREIVDQSGDAEQMLEFEDFVSTMKQWSKELGAERTLRNEMTNTQIRSANAAWKGWRMTKRGADLLQGRASLADARFLWRAYEGNETSSPNLQGTNGEWDDLMRSFDDDPTDDVLETYEE